MSIPKDVRFHLPVMEWAERASEERRNSIRSLEAMIAQEPGTLEQSRRCSLALDYQSLALYEYALGFPIAHVRKQLSASANSWLSVFVLRATEEAFPVVLVTIDTQHPSDPRHAIERPMHPPGTKDYSLTNSKSNLRAVCIAMSAGEWDIAPRLAALAWDPPTASFINSRSEICRPYDQHLAYAVRHLFTDEHRKAVAELDKVRTRPTEVRPRELANLIRALINDDRESFLTALENLLNWHEHIKSDSAWYEFYGENDKFLCLWAIGFSAWAVRRGLIDVADLPQSNVYLPIELIGSN
jgi:hypothetical protein